MFLNLLSSQDVTNLCKLIKDMFWDSYNIVVIKSTCANIKSILTPTTTDGRRKFFFSQGEIPKVIHIALLAPNVLLDYLGPMITIPSRPSIDD